MKVVFLSDTGCFVFVFVQFHAYHHQFYAILTILSS